MPVVTHKYTNMVFTVATFSQGHVAAVSAEIYTCVWERRWLDKAVFLQETMSSSM